MKRHTVIWSVMAAAFAVFVVVVLATGGIGDVFSGGKSAQAVLSTTDCNNQQAVSNLLMEQGFKAGDFTVGEDKFNLDLPAAKQAGDGKFADKPLTTKDAYVAFLKSDVPAAQAVKKHLLEAQPGATADQIVDPNNIEGFQILVESEWGGNTSFADGKTVAAGTRQSQKGDIGWVFINPSACTKNGNVPTTALTVVRMACGNPQLTPPTPVGGKPTPSTSPPGTPTTTSTTTPPNTPVCQYNSSLPPNSPMCLPPKVPTQDVNVNPAVPSGVQGPGTTPVGTDPGPATPVYDTPCGLAICPTTTTQAPAPSPSPTTTTLAPTPTPVTPDPPADGDPGAPPSS